MNFDINQFKKAVKKWLVENPEGHMDDLGDFCESLIPAALYPSHQWLVEQTLGWFQHIKTVREESLNNDSDQA